MLIDFTVSKDEQGQYKVFGSEIIKGDKGFPFTTSQYQPSDDEKLIRQLIVNHFRLGDLTQKKPRFEFNDLSVISRSQVDQMAWNTYQSNNGDAVEGDEQGAWRSRAMRPVVRNKCVSIAAHATARLVFPKIFAHNEASEEQTDAAMVMRDLIEYTAEQSDYVGTALYATLAALINPASIVHTEYCETYRDVKREKENGKYKIETILDEDLSGFIDTVVPVDQFYIENFYEHDVQKQGFLIWRRVQNYSLLEQKYGKRYKNFKYVKPGVQLIYNDANQTFYEVYDSSLRQDMCEEVLYWNKSKDLFIIMVNGVMLTEPDNPNPRLDKRYPFISFGYELIDAGKCFYYKSLAFKLMQDANIINTLYPMIIDGTYLNLMPPMINRGGEMIDSSVIIPGAVTTLSDPNAKIEPIGIAQNLSAGMNTLFKIDESINDSSITPPMMHSKETAYAMAMQQKESDIILGLFVSMISQFVKDYGKLRISDILQYLTIADVDKVMDNPKLIYKTFLMPDKQVQGKKKTRKIKFDGDMPSEPMDKDTYLKESYKVLQEGGEKTELFRVNPSLFRDLKFMVSVNQDVMNPLSEELERAMGLEIFDKSIQALQVGVPVDMEQAYKDFVLLNYPKTQGDTEKYIKKQEPNQNPMNMVSAQPQPNPQPTNGAQPSAPQVPSFMNKVANAQPNAVQRQPKGPML